MMAGMDESQISVIIYSLAVLFSECFWRKSLEGKGAAGVMTSV